MTRSEAESLIQAIVTLRDNVTDEQALSSVAIYPAWRTDATYITGQRIRHGGVLYKVLQDHTSQSGWVPDVSPSLFGKVLIPDPEVIPEWEQPDSTNAYMSGDKVTHNGSTWISVVDNNVWEPGAYGWEVVV